VLKESSAFFYIRFVGLGRAANHLLRNHPFITFVAQINTYGITQSAKQKRRQEIFE